MQPSAAAPWTVRSARPRAAASAGSSHSSNRLAARHHAACSTPLARPSPPRPERRLPPSRTARTAGRAPSAGTALQLSNGIVLRRAESRDDLRTFADLTREYYDWLAVSGCCEVRRRGRHGMLCRSAEGRGAPQRTRNTRARAHAHRRTHTHTPTQTRTRTHTTHPPRSTCASRASRTSSPPYPAATPLPAAASSSPPARPPPPATALPLVLQPLPLARRRWSRSAASRCGPFQKKGHQSPIRPLATATAAGAAARTAAARAARAARAR